jgi:predicted nucleotidyltransferase
VPTAASWPFGAKQCPRSRIAGNTAPVGECGRTMSIVDSDSFAAWFTDRIAGLRGVEAVALGGSRALGTATTSSDWDFALYYRDRFDPDDVRGLGFDGVVSDVGGWGGGVMNGGAWLTVAGRRVDLHYRDLTDVEHWWGEADAGRYRKQLLPFYIAGIPTYTVVAELAVCTVLAGQLPRPAYPDALVSVAAARWREDALLSIGYARRALTERDDATVAVANGSRALIELAHSRAALGRRWVLNEKGLVKSSGLDHVGIALAFAAHQIALSDALAAVEEAASGQT